MAATKHRERAVEAAARAAFFRDDVGGHIKGGFTYDSIPEVGRENYRCMVRDALEAAEPHLQRMYWERLREVLLEHEAKADGALAMNRAYLDAASDFEQYEAAICAALDKAQEIMEGGDRG
jgi:hypothetical protein